MSLIKIHAGLIERPSNMTVDRGKQVTFTCTYRTAEAQPTINWDKPFGITTTQSLGRLDGNTLQSNLTFTANSSAYASDYLCTVTAESAQISSEVATLSISCKFNDNTPHSQLVTLLFLYIVWFN